VWRGERRGEGKSGAYGVAFGQDRPVYAGGGEVVAWAEGGFEEEEGVGGCGEGHAVLGGVSLRQW
jgi:hypothetical protein